MTLERTGRAIDELTVGAEVLAAGRTLGLSDDETISTKRQTLRRQQRERRAQRGQREGNRAAAEQFLADDDAAFRAKGKLTDFERELALGSRVRADIDDQAWAFGEDAQWLRDDKGHKVGKEPRRPQDDEQVYSRSEKVRNDVLGKDFLQPQEIEMQKEGRSRPQQGIGGMRDAFRRLEMAKEQYGFAAFGAEGPEMERLYYRLKSELGDGQALGRDRAEAAKAVMADAKRRRGEVDDREIEKAVDQVVRNAAYDRRDRSAAAPIGFKRDAPVAQSDPNIFYDKRGKLRGMNRDAGDVTIRAHAGVQGVDLADDIRDQLLVRREAGRAMAPEFRRMRNDAKAAREARAIANKDGGLRRQLADEDIGNIAEIRNLGVAGAAGHGVLEPGNYQVVTEVNPSAFGQALPLIGKDGMPIAHFERVGDQLLQLGNDVNSPDTSNVLNAPKATPVQQWVAGNQPLFGKNNVFGEPQVEINDMMALVGDRVRGLGGFGYEGVGNPRNLAEFDQMINAVAARGKKLNKQFFRFDPDQRKNIAVANPGVSEVMGMLRIPQAQQEKIAWALMQQQLADASPVNQADKERFARREERPLARGSRPGVNMNAAEMRADGGVPIDMIVNERIGRGKKAKGVRAGLAAINDEGVMNALNEQGQLIDVADKDVFIKDKLIQRKGQRVLLPEAARIIAGAQEVRNDAQMPMQAAIKGEGAKRARFIRGEARKMSPQELVEKYGEENARKALQVEMRHERAKRGEIRRGGAVGIDPIAQIQRAKDVEAREAGYKAEYDFEAAERDEILKLMNQGATVDAPFELGQGNRVIEAAPAGRRLVVPNDSSFGGRKQLLDKGVPISEAPGWQRNQPIQEAPTPMSIAPEPGAGTGNQPAPMIDAGGAGMKPPTRTAVSPQMPDPWEDKGGALVSLRKPAAPQPSPESKYYDGGNSRFDVATRFDTDPFRSTGLADPDPDKTFKDSVRRIREGGEKAVNVVKDFATNPKYQRKRRIGYGIGGGAAALATILNMGNEEEQEQLR